VLSNGFDRESEAGPLIQLRSDRNSTAKGLNDPLADAKAQTDAACVDALGGAQLSEESKKLLLVCLRDADAGILHRHYEEVGVSIERDFD
jgi:hypothetical protein